MRSQLMVIVPAGLRPLRYFNAAGLFHNAVSFNTLRHDYKHNALTIFAANLYYVECWNIFFKPLRIETFIRLVYIINTLSNFLYERKKK